MNTQKRQAKLTSLQNSAKRENTINFQRRRLSRLTRYSAAAPSIAACLPTSVNRPICYRNRQQV